MTARLVITAGEPAGIGPDLLIQLAQKSWTCQLVVCADKTLLQQRAEKLGLTLELIEYQHHSPAFPQPAGTLTVLHEPLACAAVAGSLDTRNGQYVVRTLERACQGCLSGEFNALVTGPVHKGIINEAGIAFSGHTECFAQQSGCRDVVMMLATEGLRVALVTTHIPIASVSAAITSTRLETIIRILHRDLVNRFHLESPRILVCGLNPHAGESGHLGREEIDTIEPTLERLRLEDNFLLTGPLPADTVFQPKYLDMGDVVLAMYHDQGLPVLKYKGFGAAVNITLGLPFVRTSVDHGTALDLAGTNMADTGSFELAIRQAIKMADTSL